MIRAPFVGMCLLAALAAACTPTSKQTQATASAAPADPPGVPPCANHLTVTRSDNTSAVYKGADPSDPAICLISINGTLTRSVWGAWTLRESAGPRPGAVKDVLARITSGPVGTKALISWPVGDHGVNTTRVERLPDETVTVGSQTHNCMVFHSTDNYGNEFFWSFDPNNHIALRSKGTYPSTYDWHATEIAPST